MAHEGRRQQIQDTRMSKEQRIMERAKLQELVFRAMNGDMNAYKELICANGIQTADDKLAVAAMRGDQRAYAELLNPGSYPEKREPDEINDNLDVSYGEERPHRS